MDGTGRWRRVRPAAGWPRTGAKSIRECVDAATEAELNISPYAFSSEKSNTFTEVQGLMKLLERFLRMLREMLKEVRLQAIGRLAEPGICQFVKRLLQLANFA
jgi:undecaprenyl diphosphate synthase